MLHSSMDNANNETTRSEASSASVRMARLGASPGARIATGAAVGPADRQSELRHRVFSQAHSITAIRRCEDAHRSTNSSRPILQRKCACEGSGRDCATCDEKKESNLQRKAGDHPEPGSVPHIVHEVLSSSGNPLDANTRAFMEPRFGYDLGGVRIHTDSKAAESAQAVNALAYTVGNNIVFGASHYAPNTNNGRRLLAHELAHTVQQAGQTALQVNSKLAPRILGLKLKLIEFAASVLNATLDGNAVADRISRQPRSGIIRRAAIHTGNILDEGTCAHLACKSKWACRDDTNGITCPKGTRNADATKKFVPCLPVTITARKALRAQTPGPGWPFPTHVSSLQNVGRTS